MESAIKPPTDDAATLKQDVGPEVYRELVAAYLVDLPRQVAALKDAAEVGDIPAARFVAHQIKGSASGFGATALDDLAGRVLTLDRDQGQVLGSLVDEIDRAVRRFHDENAVPETFGDGVGTLEADVGPEVYQELLAVFADDLSRQVAALQNAAEVGDFPAARFVAHQIKGSAPGFGAVHLDEVAGSLLQIGRDQGDLLRSLVDEIEREVRRIEAALGR